MEILHRKDNNIVVVEIDIYLMEGIIQRLLDDSFSTYGRYSLMKDTEVIRKAREALKTRIENLLMSQVALADIFDAIDKEYDSKAEE